MALHEFVKMCSRLLPIAECGVRNLLPGKPDRVPPSIYDFTTNTAAEQDIVLMATTQLGHVYYHIELAAFPYNSVKQMFETAHSYGAGGDNPYTLDRILLLRPPQLPVTEPGDPFLPDHLSALQVAANQCLVFMNRIAITATMPSPADSSRLSITHQRMRNLFVVHLIEARLPMPVALQQYVSTALIFRDRALFPTTFDARLAYQLIKRLSDTSCITREDRVRLGERVAKLVRRGRGLTVPTNRTGASTGDANDDRDALAAVNILLRDVGIEVPSDDNQRSRQLAAPHAHPDSYRSTRTREDDRHRQPEARKERPRPQLTLARGDSGHRTYRERTRSPLPRGSHRSRSPAQASYREAPSPAGDRSRMDQRRPEQSTGDYRDVRSRNDQRRVVLLDHEEPVRDSQRHDEQRRVVLTTRTEPSRGDCRRDEPLCAAPRPEDSRREDRARTIQRPAEYHHHDARRHTYQQGPRSKERTPDRQLLRRDIAYSPTQDYEGREIATHTRNYTPDNDKSRALPATRRLAPVTAPASAPQQRHVPSASPADNEDMDLDSEKPKTASQAADVAAPQPAVARDTAYSTALRRGGGKIRPLPKRQQTAAEDKGSAEVVQEGGYDPRSDDEDENLPAARLGSNNSPGRAILPDPEFKRYRQQEREQDAERAHELEQQRDIDDMALDDMLASQLVSSSPISHRDLSPPLGLDAEQS